MFTFKGRASANFEITVSHHPQKRLTPFCRLGGGGEANRQNKLQLIEVYFRLRGQKSSKN